MNIAELILHPLRQALHVAVNARVPARSRRLGGRRHVDAEIAQSQGQLDRVTAGGHNRVAKFDPARSGGRRAAPFSIALIALPSPLFIPLRVAPLTLGQTLTILFPRVR